MNFPSEPTGSQPGGIEGGCYGQQGSHLPAPSNYFGVSVGTTDVPVRAINLNNIWLGGRDDHGALMLTQTKGE